jgi:hypothetical protein
MMVAYSLDNDRTQVGVLMGPDTREAFPDLIAQAEGNAPPVSRINCPAAKPPWCRDQSMMKAVATLQMSNKSRYDDIGCRQSDVQSQT